MQISLPSKKKGMLLRNAETHVLRFFQTAKNGAVVSAYARAETVLAQSSAQGAEQCRSRQR